jgi:hypothetical protein
VREFRSDWEKDLINPLISEGSNKEWMEHVEQRIRKKRNSFKRSSRLLGSVAVVVLALGIFAVKKDYLLNLIPNWSNLQRASQTQTIPQNKIIENQSPAPVISPNPTPNASIPPDQRYIVYKNAYYVKTDEVLPTLQVGNKVLTVTRIGDWAIKKEGDTNEFTPGSDLYTVKGSDDSKMAVKVSRGKTSSGTTIYEYQIVKRYAPVIQTESSTILGAKGDYNEVAIAINNIRKKDPYLFELTEMDSRAKLFSASYIDPITEGMSVYGTYLIYELPEADVNKNLQGILEIAEYSEADKQQGKIQNSIYGGNGKKATKTNQSDEPQVKAQFEMNSLRWLDYGNGTYVGRTGDRYYEIHLQGKLTDEKLKDVLKHFVKTAS